jgi:hypothetical protein
MYQYFWVEKNLAFYLKTNVTTLYVCLNSKKTLVKTANFFPPNFLQKYF